MHKPSPDKQTQERMNRLQIVPWFDKKEWQETYNNAYSSDTKLQEKAYTEMCIWKIRYPNLPLGVECTMSMLHVRLCDKQTDDGSSTTSYREKDLQLLYSTAVMRFLNHLTVMSNCKDSMYRMAEQHNIPDWLINLRHEAAHGNSVPALYLLREAGDIILQWLKEHYWEAEARIMKDVVVEESLEDDEESKRISELLQLWLNFKISIWSGIKTVDKMTNVNLRNFACKIIEEGKTGTGNEKTEGNEMEIDVQPQIQTCTIKSVFETFLRRLFEPLKKKKLKQKYQKYLVECLIKYEGFCPSLNVSKLGENASIQVMSVLWDLWKEVVEGLRQHDIVSQLICRLSESADDLTSSAHLWLRLFTQLLSGQSLPVAPVMHNTAQLLADALPCDVMPKAIVDNTNSRNPQHHKPITLKPASPKEAEALQRLATRVLESPTKLTCRYISSLTLFLEPEVCEETREQLTTAARIYCGLNISDKSSTSTSAAANSQMYSVDSLQQLGCEVSAAEDKQSPVQRQLPVYSRWSVYSGSADWSKCALGALPW